MSETPYSRLPRWRRRFELASIWFTLYSVFCLVAEMEVSPQAETSTGWWLWNERLGGAWIDVLKERRESLAKLLAEKTCEE